MTNLDTFNRALLALDTSTDQAGVAVRHDEQVATLAWQAGRNHTVQLLDQVHRLLGLAGLEPGDLGGVVVAIGPGAFTGLRVGMSVAKGLCMALDLPLAGVSTLACAATTALACDRPAIAAVAAGRGRLAWAVYERGPDGEPIEIAPPVNGAPAELAAAIAHIGNPILTGELGTHADLFRQAGAIVLPAELRVRRPEALLALAAPRFAAGTTDDPVTLEPIYLSR
jgi:tRNA threonylcarbamoyladenosine biosynthesis protein TsaB